MSENRPRVWWSPGEGVLIENVRAHGCNRLNGGDWFEEPPADAVELQPVSDAPAAPVETETVTEWAALMESDEDDPGFVVASETSARILAEREQAHGLFRRTVTRSEWQEVADDG